MYTYLPVIAFLTIVILLGVYLMTHISEIEAMTKLF